MKMETYCLLAIVLTILIYNYFGRDSIWLIVWFIIAAFTPIIWRLIQKNK